MPSRLGGIYSNHLIYIYIYVFYLMVANSFDIPKQWSSGLGEKHYQYDADGGLAAQPPHSDTIKKLLYILPNSHLSCFFSTTRTAD